MGDILNIKHGFPFLGEFFSDKGDYIILTPGNFFEAGGFKRVEGKEKFYLAEFPEEYLCSKGDLVVAMTQQAEGLLGSTALIPEDNIYLHNQRIGLISFNEKRTNKLYLYYLFMTPWVRQQIRATASGSKVKHTSPERIYDVKVWLPSLPQQKAIASFIYNIDQKIQLNNTINAELEKAAKTLYSYWFVQFDFPNAKGKPYRTSGGKMEYNEVLKREIPKGWKAERFIDLATITTGKEDANFATSDGTYNFFTCGRDILRCDKPAFSGQAVLLAGNGDFNVKHYTGEFNAYQRTYVLTPKHSAHYAAMYIAASDKVAELKMGAYGSIVKFITMSDVANIALPVNHEYNYLFEKLTVIINEIELLERENDELKKLRDFLLPLLMNGQVKVREGKDGLNHG